MTMILESLTSGFILLFIDYIITAAILKKSYCKWKKIKIKDDEINKHTFIENNLSW